MNRSQDVRSWGVKVVPETGRSDLEAMVQAARAARAVGESAARWWQDLAAEADTTVSSQSLDRLIRRYLEATRQALGADTASLLVADDTGQELVARASVGLKEELATGLRIGRGKGMAGRVLEAMEPLIIGDLSTVELASSTIRDSGVISVVAVPIVSGDRALGVLHAGARAPDRFSGDDAELLGLLAERLGGAMERVSAFQTEHAARRHAEALARRLAVLHEATVSLANLGALTDIVQVLDELVGRLSPPDPSRRISLWSRHGDRLVWTEGSGAAPDRGAPIALHDPLPLCVAVREGRSIIATGEAQEDYPQLVVAAPGVRSFAVVPVAAGAPPHAPAGAVAVTSELTQALAPAEPDLLPGLLQQAAQAIERVWIREERDRIARFSAFLAEAARVLAEAPGFEQALDRLAGLALPALGDICLIDIMTEDGSIERMVARHRDPARQPLVDRLRAEFAPDPQGDHPAAAVMRSRQTAWSGEMSERFLERTTRDAEHLALVKELRFESYLTVPLTSPGVLGAATFVSTSRSFDAEDVHFAEELARQVAAVVGNAHRYEATLQTSHVLQHSLLPPSVPPIPGARIHTRYLAAGSGIDVGGDFYDVSTPTPYEVDFVIGDVAGHDREAAAMMGRLRSAARALAIRADGPGDVVAALQAGWERLGFSRMATALFARFVTASGQLQMVSAGHYPPLLLGAGAPHFLPVPPNPPLGVATGRVPTDRVARWEGQIGPGQALLLYTDGAIDERVVGSEASMADLAAAAAAGPLEPEAICDRAIAAVDWEQADDVALLAICFE